MYGKIDENGKFQAAPAVKKVTHEGGKTVIEHYTNEELAAMDYKEVLNAEGEGRPGPGMRPSPVFEDKGEFIIRRMNWVESKTTKK